MWRFGLFLQCSGTGGPALHESRYCVNVSGRFLLLWQKDDLEHENRGSSSSPLPTMLPAIVWHPDVQSGVAFLRNSEMTYLISWPHARFKCRITQACPLVWLFRLAKKAEVGRTLTFWWTVTMELQLRLQANTNSMERKQTAWLGKETHNCYKRKANLPKSTETVAFRM